MSLGWRRLLTLLAAVALLLVLASQFTLRRDSRAAPDAGEAAYNPLYAAQLTLQQLGLDSDSGDARQALRQASANTTILQTTAPAALTSQQTQSMLGWVNLGGHWILPATAVAAEDAGNSLLTVLGVDLIPTPRYRHASWRGQPDRIIGYPGHTALRSHGDGDILLRANGHPVALQLTYGQGLITLMTSLDFLDNARLAQPNHATVLWQLLHPSDRQPARVLLVYRDRPRSLLSLLWQNARPMLALLGCAGLLWIWRGQMRFGPRQPLPPPTDSLRLQLLARGYQAWRQRALSPLYQQTEDYLRHARPGQNSGRRSAQPTALDTPARVIQATRTLTRHDN